MPELAATIFFSKEKFFREQKSLTASNPVAGQTLQFLRDLFLLRTADLFLAAGGPACTLAARAAMFGTREKIPARIKALFPQQASFSRKISFPRESIFISFRHGTGHSEFISESGNLGQRDAETSSA